MSTGARTRAIAAHVAARTGFFDDEVLQAIAGGVQQVVICGAGYDDRALRFRSPGVRYFELDLPTTQDDKRRRLLQMGADTSGLVLVPADLGLDDVAAVLATGGHEARRPSLFLCEGLFVYLERSGCERLLAGLRDRAAAGSRLAASLAVHPGALDADDMAAVAGAANARRGGGRTEPWRTILPLPEHFRLFAATGWCVITSRDIAGLGQGQSSGRSVVVAAEPAGGEAR